jgi:hypothetical protein
MGGLEVKTSSPAFQDSSYVVIRAGARVAGPVHTEGIVRLVVEPGADVAQAEFSGNLPAAWD